MADAGALDALVQALRILPGVGIKSAQRMAFHLLQRDRAGAGQLAQALQTAAASVRHCERCHTFTEAPVCATCLDPARTGIEHDIMESFSPGCVGRHMFHMNGYGADYRGFSAPRPVKGAPTHTLDVSTDEFHTFGLLWEPDGYTVFVDGRQDGWSRGLTIEQFARLFSELGCKAAYNLDGGASVTMTFMGALYNRQSSERELGDILLIKELPEAGVQP